MKQMKLFLSYARDDDQAFVKRLYNDLKRLGFDVWWDMVSMPSRDLTFLQEIRDAINGVDRLLLVVGPKAVDPESHYVRAEWKYAREICTPINPILRVGVGNDDDKEDFGQLPDELKNLDTRDFRNDADYADQLDRLVKQLREDIPSLGRLSPNVPALPPHHLPRPEHLAVLSGHVLRDINVPTVITAEHKMTTVQGMGGIGKTVIATAFAHACTTRRAFSDGIVWVTVGQRAEMRTLYEVAGVGLGDTPQNYREEVAAKANLQKMLADKMCLIVLDDVWRMEHAAPFRDLVADGRSRLLITTRDGGLAAGLGAQEHVLDLLRDDQALALLAGWSDLPVDALPDEAPDVMRECGNLPLPLAMIGATVRGKPDRWRHVLHRLRTADVGKIRQRFPNYPYENVLSAIQISVDDLEPDHRARYLDFTVFREDTPIPEAAVITLWEPLGLDEFDAVEVLDVLVARSLLRRESDGRLALHDLQVNYVSNAAVRQDAGVEPVFALHERLLTAYHAKCPNGWHTGPNDGYFFKNLAYHLRAAGLHNELYTLLTESATDGGSNPWMEAKFITCVGDTSYGADLNLAISDFVDPLELDHLFVLARLHTARQVVHARVSSYTDEDLKILVRLGRKQEALSHARLRREPAERFRGMMAIYGVQKQQLHTELELLDECHKASDSIQNVHDRVWALFNLAKVLAQAQQYTQAQEVADNIHDVSYQGFALRELAKALAHAQQYPRVREVIDSIRDVGSRVRALLDFAEVLDQAQQPEQAATVFTNAREVIDSIYDKKIQAWLLLNLATTLDRSQRPEQAVTVFNAAHKVSDDIRDPKDRALSLHVLAKALAQEAQQYTQAREVADSIADEYHRAEGLRSLAQALCQAEQYTQAREVVDSITNEKLQAEALRDLATAFARAQQYTASRELAGSICDARLRAAALRDLAEALAQAQQTEQSAAIFNIVRKMVDSIRDANVRAWMLRDLAIALARSQQYIQAREVANGIQDTKQRAMALYGMAESLIQAQQTEQAEKIFITTREVAGNIQDSGVQIRALCRLAIALAQAQQTEQAVSLLSVAREITDTIQTTDLQESALHDLAKALRQTQQYAQAREVIDRIRDSRVQMRELQNLAIDLAWAQQYIQAREVADSIYDTKDRAKALRILAQALCQAEQYTQAREVIDSIQDKQRCSEALSILAVTLAQSRQIEQSRRVFIAAREVADSIQNIHGVVDSIQNRRSRAKALITLATALAQTQQTEQSMAVFSTVYELANSIQNVRIQAELWRALPREAIDKIEHSEIREAALRARAAIPTSSEQYKQLHKAVEGIRDAGSIALILRNLTVPLDQANNIPEAFDTLGTHGLDELIETVSTWNLPPAILYEIVRIVGWMRPDWREIHELITSDV